MSDDGHKEQQRADEAAEHVGSILPQAFAVLEQLFALERELLRDMDRVM